MYRILLYQDRILFAYYKDNIFIILTVFKKKTKKTPKKEIEKAKRFFNNFKKRNEFYDGKVYGME